MREMKNCLQSVMIIIPLSLLLCGIVKEIDKHVSMGPYYRVDFANVNDRRELARHRFGFQVTIKL